MPSSGYKRTMLLFLVAAVIAIVGVVQLFQGQILFGLVLLVVACLVGPGGYSVFRSRHVSGPAAGGILSPGAQAGDHGGR